MYRGSLPPAHKRAQITSFPNPCSTADAPSSPTLIVSNDRQMSFEELQAMAEHLAEQLKLATPVSVRPAPVEPLHCPHCEMRIKPPEDIEIDGFRYDLSGRNLYYNGKRIHITVCEAYILHGIMEGRGRVVTRESLWMNSKGPGLEPDSDIKIIDVYVCKLRRKIFAATGVYPIQTDWGRGHYWKIGGPPNRGHRA